MANGFIEDIPPGISQEEFDVLAGPFLRQAARPSGLQRFGRGLVRAAAGARNPTGFLQQLQQQEQTKAAALQLALENLPEGDIRRDQLAAQFDVLVGTPGAGAAFRAQPAQPEGFTLAPGSRRFEQVPGQAPRLVAEGREPVGRPLTEVNIGRQEFGGKIVEAEVGAIVEEGRQAAGREANFQQLFDLLSSPEVQTGALQPAITGLQAIAADFGADLNAVAQSAGIELGALADKESFNRVSRQLVIDSFQQFKGNLNAQEVRIAEESMARLGTSEEANIDAVAAGMAAAQIARERGLLGINATSFSEGRALLRRVTSGDASEFIRRKNEIADDLRKSRGLSVEPAQFERPPALDLPSGSVFIRTEPDGRRVYRRPDGKFIRELP